MANKGEQAYIIKSFRGGVADYEDKGIEGSYQGSYNIDQTHEEDVLSCGQALTEEGLLDERSPSLSQSPSSSVSRSPSPSPSASPSPTPSPSASQSPSSSVSLSPSTTPSRSISPSPSVSEAITSVFRDLIRTFVKCSDGYTYGFGDTGYIYRRDADGLWLRMYKDADGAIKGAEESFSSTKQYLVWATDTKLKKKEIPGRDDWNDVEVVATNLNSADWHTMKLVAGSTMICNRSWLAMIGYDQSYTNEALDLIPGNIAKTIVERNGRAIIGTGRLNDPNKSINAAIDSEVPLAQAGDNGELFYADMVNSMPIKRFPGGGKVNPGGVANKIDQVNFFEWSQTALSWISKQSLGNYSVWGVYNADTGLGGIYSFGRRNKNKPFILNLDHLLDVDEIGAVTVVDGKILASYRDGVDEGVKAVDDNAKAEARYVGLDLKSKPKYPGEITTYTRVKITCKPLPDGCGIEFWYRINKSGEFVQAYNERQEVLFRGAGETEAVFLIGSNAKVFTPCLVLKPSGNNTPEVTEIEILSE